ncbi:MAG: hypothetical protein WD023_01770 [Ilumatobacteraceae bacterium]
MRTSGRTKAIIAATAGVGALTMMAGNAFTAGGTYDTSGDGFVGGTVDQVIFGANITNVAYDLDGDTIDSVTVTFVNPNQPNTYPDGPASEQDVNGMAFSIVFSNGGTPIGTYTCEDVGDTTDFVSTCTPTVATTSRLVDKITMTVQEP